MGSKKKVNLNEYDLTTTLGTGSFGRVMLCKSKKSGDYYAMKRLKKADIIKLRQVDHVISENNILADIDSPFLVSFPLNLEFGNVANQVISNLQLPILILLFYFLAGRSQRIRSRLKVSVLLNGLYSRW